MGFHMGAVQSIAEAIIPFEHIGNARYRPVRPFIEIVHGQRIDRAIQPLERRIAVRRPAAGDMHGLSRQRIAIVEVSVEVEFGFKTVDHPTT